LPYPAAAYYSDPIMRIFRPKYTTPDGETVVLDTHWNFAFKDANGKWTSRKGLAGKVATLELAKKTQADADRARSMDPSLALTPHVPPIEITDSLKRFRKDHPNPHGLAFVMMQFGDSKNHKLILRHIKKCLKSNGLTALRADDKQYHDDLYYNILTYIYGSRFGIAVYDRIETNNFNPNVSLEVGYMLGIQKKACYLKERTLTALQTDLIGKWYRVFDVQNCEKTINSALLSWMTQIDLLNQ
jgi:hypothetical protein